MSYRYSERDCYAAMIRAAAVLRLAVVLPKGRKYSASLVETAAAFGVPVASYVDETHDRLVLDHAPSCYGGGVRPMICKAGHTGHHTPHWWKPSAGLGPGAVPPKQFCHILGAVEGMASLFDDKVTR